MKKQKGTKSEDAKMQSVLHQTLLKKALGYVQDEVVEEYVSDGEDGLKLSKKKVTKKNVAPDICAAKILLEHLTNGKEAFDGIDTQALLDEKERLTELLKSEECYD